MALYLDGSKISNSLVIDGQVEGISLVYNCRIGVTASNKVQSPVDINNYIDVSGTTVTLKRNNNTYHLWMYSPQLLQVGKAYAFVFDSITNYDENYYIEYTSDITANPIVATRIGYVDTDNLINGFVIEPTVSAYYGVAIWSNNTNDIVVSNPRFVEIGKNTDGGGGNSPVVFSVNASHPNNPTTYDIVVTAGGTTVFSKNYSCTVYGVFAQDTDTFTYNGTTYTVLAQGYQANNGQKMLDFSIDTKSYSVYCSTSNSSYATDDTFTLIVGGGTPIPKLLSAQSRNISSIGSLTYTFTESGTFQYYAMFHYNGVIVSTDVTVKLNGVTISPTLHTDTEISGSGSWGWFCGEITVNANDIISVENNSSHSNYPLQLFVLQNADISNFRLVGVTENNDNYFTLNTGDSFYLNVFQCGYWGSTVNNFNYEIGIYGNRSVMTPAGDSDYYYGFTWVITI